VHIDFQPTNSDQARKADLKKITRIIIQNYYTTFPNSNVPAVEHANLDNEYCIAASCCTLPLITIISQSYVQTPINFQHTPSIAGDYSLE
jgi:hypothetical protein